MPRYTAGSLALVRKLIRITSEMYPDPASRVDIEELLKLCCLPAQRRELNSLIQPWLRVQYQQPGGIVLWCIQNEATSMSMVTMLQLFLGYINAVVATATKLRETAAVLRIHGWQQHHVGSDVTGFDIHGAIGFVFQGETSTLRLMVLDVLRSKIQEITGLPDTTVSLGDWNDAPGRTAGDVLSLLEGCAAEVECIN